MVLLDEPHLKIEFRNVPCRYIVTTWTGNVGSDVYRKKLAVIIRCSRENGVRKLLNDTRLRETLLDIDREFETSLLRDFGAQQGLVYQATLLASELFVRFSADNLHHTSAASPFIHQFFSDEREAIQWLTKVDN